MDERESCIDVSDNSGGLEVSALLERVAAAIAEIAHAKRERSTDAIRAARTHLAALHGVAILRREAEGELEAA